MLLKIAIPNMVLSVMKTQFLKVFSIEKKPSQNVKIKPVNTEYEIDLFVSKIILVLFQRDWHVYAQ